MELQSNRNIEDIYFLTPMQQGMLFHDLLCYRSQQRPYIQQVLWRMDRRADWPALQRAWQHVIARHPILRSFVIWENRSQPIQIVCRDVALPWREIDWSDMPEYRITAALEAHCEADCAEGFTLTRAPLMRLCAIYLPNGSSQLIWTFHHLLIDGWSLALVLGQVLEAYDIIRRGLRPPSIPAAPYRRFIDWLTRRDATGDRDFWTKLLAGVSGPTPVPGRQRGSISSTPRLTVRQLSSADTEALNTICARRRLTASVVVQVAWAILLSLYARERDITFGLTIAGRPPELPDADAIVGLFINSVPVRLKLDPAVPIFRLLQIAMEQQAEREEHLHAPLEKIKAWAGIAGDGSLFDSLVVFENYPIDRVVVNTGARLGCADIHVTDATNFALTLIAIPGDTLELKLLHDADRLSEPEASFLLANLTCVLSGIIADCDRTLADLPLVDAKEQQFLLAAGTGPVRNWEQPQLLHRLVEEQVDRSPDAIAVRFAAHDLTFRELDRRANQLAHRLCRSGVKPGCIVGIAMQRSIELMVGLLGILKAGGAFLPIDPGLPAERLAFMVSDADVSVLLVHPPVEGQLPAHRAETIYLDPDWRAIASEPETPPNMTVGPEHLAYVIYTSGSTGVPKGAMNTHGAICNRLLWMQEAYALRPDDCILQKTPSSFDVSVWEFFWPLLTGARLVVARPDGHHDPAYMARVIEQEQITTIHFVPSMLQLFLNQDGLGTSCASLRRVFCSGEALSATLAKTFSDVLGCQLHNLYGPAEAAVDVTHWQCPPNVKRKTIPIGQPIANIRIYLLDECDRLVPRGVPGELYIGGIGVGPGYLNRPEMTVERFVTRSVQGCESAQLYRTGDLALWNEEGMLEFLGRQDNQIKLRGVRIELGEIEAALLNAPAVKDAAVVLQRGSAGQDQIVAYITTKDETSAPRGNILDDLRKKLPAIMVPSRVIDVDRLPLSPNGKLDRKALAALASARPNASPNLLPGSRLELAIADVWRDVLNLDRIGLKDNFFELGGTSLLMISVHARLRDAWDATLALVELFEYPTIEALAGRLARTSAPVVPLEIERVGGAERAHRQLDLRMRRQGGKR